MSSKQKILIVDDEAIGRQLLEAVIMAEDYDLLFAENGKQAIEVAITEKPDIILLDVMMPELDGFEACRQIKQNPDLRTIPVFLVTALEDKDSRLKGLSAGANDYISKPFNRIEILSKIRNSLNGKPADNSKDETIFRPQTTQNILNFKYKFDYLLAESYSEIKGKLDKQNCAAWIEKVNEDIHFCFFGNPKIEPASELNSLIISYLPQVAYTSENPSPKIIVSNLIAELSQIESQTSLEIVNDLWLCYFVIDPSKEEAKLSGLNHFVFQALKTSIGNKKDLDIQNLSLNEEYTFTSDQLIRVLSKDFFLKHGKDKIAEMLYSPIEINKDATQPQYFASMINGIELPDSYMAFQIVC